MRRADRPGATTRERLRGALRDDEARDASVAHVHSLRQHRHPGAEDVGASPRIERAARRLSDRVEQVLPGRVRVGVATEEEAHAVAEGALAHEVIELLEDRGRLVVDDRPVVALRLVEVRELDPKRSRWTAKGPAGTTVTWDAEIVNEVDGELIAWRSLANADVATAGSVRFLPAPGGGTDLAVKLQYDPPAGSVGAWVASLFGEEPSQQIRADLNRLKWVLESGYIPPTVWDAPRSSYFSGGPA